MNETVDIGREPRRSKAGRLKLSARRGRFSPHSFQDHRDAFPVVLRLGKRPSSRRHLTHGLRVAAAAAMAGIIGASLLGLPTEASGKTKSKKQDTQNVKASKPSTRESTSPKPDYKSKYRKKDPPPSGGRPPKQKYDSNNYTKNRRPPTDKRYEKIHEPRRRWLPDLQPEPPPPIHPPPVFIYPIITPIVLVEPYEEVYYESDYYGREEPSISAEGASLLFAGASMGINYVFIRDGQVNEFAAGAGFFFGITALASAMRSDAKYPVLGVLLGSAAIVFSAWNLAGGMDGLNAYDGDAAYDDGYDSYYTVQPAGQSTGWTFSF